MPCLFWKFNQDSCQKSPLKMIFSPTISDHAQDDLGEMSSCEMEDGCTWIVHYQDHHSGKCEIGATKEKTAAQKAPIVNKSMSSMLVPNVLQSDNGGEFLRDT